MRGVGFGGVNPIGLAPTDLTIKIIYQVKNMKLRNGR